MDEDHLLQMYAGFALMGVLARPGPHPATAVAKEAFAVAEEMVRVGRAYVKKAEAARERDV